MKGEILWFDFAAVIVLLGAVLAVQLLGYSRILGEYAAGVVMASYALGKTVRDYELKVWEKRHARAREFLEKMEQARRERAEAADKKEQ